MNSLFAQRVAALALKHPRAAIALIKVQKRDAVLARICGELFGYNKIPTEPDLAKIDDATVLKAFEMLNIDHPINFSAGRDTQSASDRLAQANAQFLSPRQAKNARPAKIEMSEGVREWVSGLTPAQKLAFAEGTLHPPAHIERSEKQ